MSKPLKIEYVPIAELKPHPGNPRKHPIEAVEKIKKSIEAFGWTAPILLDADGRILAGHARLKAAQAAGIEQVPVVRLPLKGVDADVYMIADNKLQEGTEWDWTKLGDLIGELDTGDIDLSLTGFDDAELEGLMNGLDNASGNITEDEPPAVQKTAFSKTGDLWIMGDHRLLCGDSTKPKDVERVMGGEKADTVFTSPPYAVGIDYGTYKDNIENLRTMMPLMAAIWANITKTGGFAVINFGDIVSGKTIAKTDEPCEYPMALEYWPIFRNAGWLLWSRRIWCKPAAGTGSMQCISSNRAATNWEHVWTWKKPGRPIVYEQISGIWPSQCGWFDTIHDHKLDVGLDVHGAGMPVVVASRGIFLHSLDGGIIHEPFSGSGTTIIAAEQLGRKCYAIEIEPLYIDVAVRRWQNFTGKKAVLERGGKRTKLRMPKGEK